MIILIDKTTMRKFLMNSALALSAAFLISCGGGNTTSNEGGETPNPTNYYGVLANQSVDAVLWSNTSAEAHYMYMQLYDVAKSKVRQNLERVGGKNPAVILDLDETVLDNSPYMVQLIRDKSTYSEASWDEWIRQASAECIPGAVDFINFCVENGVEVFYVSNRSIEHLEPTITNLEALGLPFADMDHVLLKEGDISDKSSRRKQIMAGYSIVLYGGDNLRDYQEDFKGREEDFGKDKVNALADRMYDEFVLFPNPMYGDWTRMYVRSAPDEEAAAKEAIINRLGY